MNKLNKANTFTWIARVLSIIFILFLSVFALDAFSGNAPLYEKILGFFIHLIPSFILIIVLIISWKYPLFGGLIYIILSIAFTFFFKTYTDLIVLLIISLPPAVIGALFTASYLKNRA